MQSPTLLRAAPRSRASARLMERRCSSIWKSDATRYCLLHTATQQRGRTSRSDWMISRTPSKEPSPGNDLEIIVTHAATHHVYAPGFLSRRRLLQAGTLGWLGLDLAALLRAEEGRTARPGNTGS